MSTPADPKIHDLLTEFVDLYCELVQVNRRIGIWDMRRHAVCKNDIEDIDKAYLVKTERLGRKAVERRAVVKTRLDVVFADLVAARQQAQG
ncbi:MAG: hypothetical protein RIM33_07610 [Alphaproteobacteria bacterium]